MGKCLCVSLHGGPLRRAKCCEGRSRVKDASRHYGAACERFSHKSVQILPDYGSFSSYCLRLFYLHRLSPSLTPAEFVKALYVCHSSSMQVCEIRWNGRQRTYFICGFSMIIVKTQCKNQLKWILSRSAFSNIFDK